jgi:hypothetical protein
MAGLPKMAPLLQKPDRRRFLWSLASLGLTAKTLKSERRSEPVYRFVTPLCEVRMSVQYFASSETNGCHVVFGAPGFVPE